MVLEIITREPEGDPKRTPIIFVPGIFQGAWSYDRYVLPYLAQNGYIASAVSLRGHAGSPIKGRLRFARIRHYVDDLVKAVDRIETKYGVRPVVAGNSMGGLVAQKFLEKHHAPGAVLLATCPIHGIYKSIFRMAWYRPVTTFKVMASFSLLPLVESLDLVRWAFFSDQITDMELLQYRDLMSDESYMALVDMVLFALPRPSRVNVPMLVVGGENDRMFAPDEIRRTANAYNADCEIFPNMAHDMTLENGWQRVADRVISWMGAQGLD